jgi:Ca-activated chloride channel homolog
MTVTVPTVELLTSRTKLIAGRDQTVDVLVRVTPPARAENGNQRPRLNLSLVVDRSGSMNGDKMERARSATAYCIDQLMATDRVSVVVFDDQIELLVPSQPVENRELIKERLSTVYARNSTALHAAWVNGGMQVSEHLDSVAVNRVLLVTDGLANIGLTNTDEIVSQAAGLFARGVSTSTIGIGEDFNEDLLIPMAMAGGGNSWHVEKPEDMQRVFSVELQGLMSQFAHSATLGAIPADGVRVVDFLNDYVLNETGRYKLPDLQVGTSLEMVLQLRIPPQPTGTRLRLLDIKIGYTQQDRTVGEVVKSVLDIEFETEDAVRQLPINNEVAKVAALLMNARARKEAIQYMDQGNRAMAGQVLANALGATQVACAPMAASPEVQAEYKALADLQAAVAMPQQTKAVRKQMAYSANWRQRGK